VWPRDQLITFWCRSASGKFNPLYCQNPLHASSITCKFNPLHCQNQLLAISAPPDSERHL